MTKKTDIVGFLRKKTYKNRAKKGAFFTKIVHIFCDNEVLLKEKKTV